jgi:hypothetical protein
MGLRGHLMSTIWAAGDQPLDKPPDLFIRAASDSVSLDGFDLLV